MQLADAPPSAMAAIDAPCKVNQKSIEIAIPRPLLEISFYVGPFLHVRLNNEEGVSRM